MWIDILYFIGGLVLIIAGANILTDGASAVARSLNVSELMIGLTVVALGSSTPDLVVCLSSVFKHHSQLAIGDVVGSNIIDVLLVLGIVAVIKPFAPSRMMRTVDIPMLILSSCSLLFCGDDRMIDGYADNLINRSEGLMLLAFFILYMHMTLANAKTDSPTGSQLLSSHTETNAPQPPAIARLSSPLLNWIKIIGGLAGLVAGGNWIVDGASGIAADFGMSESLIGLTVVAFCGAAPDIATAVVATMKGRTGIALGSTIGGCIINVFLCLGLASIVAPIDATHFTSIDFITLAAGSALLWLFSRVLTPGRFTRWEGIILILCYAAYLAYTIFNV